MQWGPASFQMLLAIKSLRQENKDITTKEDFEI